MRERLSAGTDPDEEIGMKWFTQQAVFAAVVSVMALTTAGTVKAEGT